MHPAFRSTKSAALFSLLLLFLLGLPVILYLTGLPSREQTWSGVPGHLGAVGDVVRTIYDDKQSVDVLFVGSSLVRRGIDLGLVEQGLSAHLGRPVHAGSLSMSWAGTDLQYFLLRDYLDQHHPKLIVWDAPGHVSNSTEPHVQAYRWMRFGEFADTFSGLPFLFRIQAYGEMVLGAPKQLLYKLRSNLLSPEEKLDRDGFDVHQSLHTGYHDAPFIADTLPAHPAPVASLLPATSKLLYVQGPKPNVFELKYMNQIVSLAHDKDCPLVLLHMPTDLEYGDRGIPEVADWSRLFGPQTQIVGLPAAALFPGFERNRFLHFFSDGHLNANGRPAYTKAILPAILEAYDEGK